MPRPRLALALLATLAACGEGPAVDASGTTDASDATDTIVTTDEASTGEPALDILDALAAIDGLGVVEQPSERDGYRFFQLTYDQPVDHEAPAGPRFTQRMTLLHRDAAAPMVLVTAGYAISATSQKLQEPAQLLAANQLVVEHRCFGGSVRAPDDRATLTIAQAAADHHRVVVALRAIYAGAWLSTGASKSGMAAVYHRRFWPDDVVGTVAYVAPHSQGTSDPRYVEFVAKLGDEACRQALRDVQRELLLRRPEILARMQAQAAADDLTYDLLGPDRALETAVLELPFVVWQYHDAAACARVPDIAATDAEVWGFLDAHNPPAQWSDAPVLAYEPYFWQAGAELGYPAVDESAVEDLLLYPGLDVPATYVVDEDDPIYDPTALAGVSAWLASEGRALLFVYGENDPYTAAPFELGDAVDAHRFIVPGGNHGAKISQLPAAERALALARLSAWTGVAAAAAPEPVAPLRRDHPR